LIWMMQDGLAYLDEKEKQVQFVVEQEKQFRG
jgi:hypothetical protein